MAQQKQQLREVLQKLERLVKELEQKDVDVEAGLARFQEGVALVKLCQSQLKEAENTFTKLKAELEEANEDPSA